MFLSGTIGEERALQALRHGASDYVLKDSAGRFLPAIRNALLQGQREAAKREAEESLRRSREQFRQIAENIDDFIVLLDEQGLCLYTNPTFRRLLGRPDVSTAFSIFEDVHPDDRGAFANSSRPPRRRPARATSNTASSWPEASFVTWKRG